MSFKCGMRTRLRADASARQGAECGMLAALLPVAAFAGEEPMPKLLPPRGELPASFAERFGWLIILVALVLVAAAALAVLMRMRRVRPPVITAPDVFARRALEALRGRPEDGALLVEASGILRRYVVFAFGLMPGELTTAELRVLLDARPDTDAHLTGAIIGFLRQCDERKFSPVPPIAQSGAVEAALGIIEKIESGRRAKLTEPSALSQPAGAPSPS